MKRFAYFDGQVLPIEEAKVSISDIGLMRGFGLYEAIAVFGGRPLRLADHWQRLEGGAKILGLKVPINAKEAGQIIGEISEKSGLKRRANVRVILTGGETLGGIDFNPTKPTFYILIEEWSKLPEGNYQKGAKLITHEYLREMPEVKTTNYIRAVSLQEKKKKEDALEILYVSKNKVSECATSNIFLVKNNTLITPHKNILEGVTRKIVLELTNGTYQIEEREVVMTELKSADEIFITASFKDIVPIVKIDEYEIGSGKAGPVTRDIIEKYAEYIGQS